MNRDPLRAWLDTQAGEHDALKVMACADKMEAALRSVLDLYDAQPPCPECGAMFCPDQVRRAIGGSLGVGE